MEAFILCMLVGIFGFTGAKDHSNGWNANIDWKPFDEALVLSEEMNKPIMLIIHKSWCGACKSLKPKFAESKEIEELSPNFIMVNTLDDEEPEGEKYTPDGGYIPRIMFINKGDVVKELYHEAGNAKYKYYYHSPEGILTTMKKAIQTFDAPANNVITDEL